MGAYPHLSARIFNTPLLIHPAALDAIVAGVGNRLLGLQLDVSGDSAPGMFVSARSERSDNGYSVSDGVAIIDVSGVLAHKSRMEADCTRILGYQDVAKSLDAALADPAVSAILFNLDSPGGEVAGAFDLAAKIYAARGVKPMDAVASDQAASACYLLGAAVGSLAVTQTGTVGSVGVVMRHVNMSAALEKQGLSVSFIYAGAHKIDGNAFSPLSDGVRADFQSSIDKLYGMFVDSISLYRRMDAAAIRATEARCYTGADAVAAGLADRVATPDQVIQDLRMRASASRPLRAGARATHSNRSTHMGEHEQGSGGANANPEARFAQADIDRARAEGHAEGMKTGMAQERERVSGILDHPEAEGRGDLARTCVTQGLSVAQAGAMLAASPKAAAPASAGSQFAQVMAGLNPPVKPGADSSEGASAGDLVTMMVGFAAGHKK